MRKFVAENGESIVALNDTQVEAILKAGLTEVFESEGTEQEEVAVEVKPALKAKKGK